MIGLIQNQNKEGHPRKWLIWATVSLGTFMATLDGGIVNVALPFISKQFQVSITQVEWVVTAYLLTISSLLLFFGRLADMIGRRRIFSAGFLVFIIGSGLCGVSQNLTTLVLFRVLQAIGSSMLMANSMGIISTSFPPQQRGRALGMGGTVVALGSMTGPALGGLLVKLLGWPSIFYINLPIGLIGFIAALSIIPESHTEEKPRFDIPGSITFALGIIAILYGLNVSEYNGWNSLLTMGPIIGGFLLLLFFLYWEKGHPAPMMDLSLFKNKTFLFGNIAGLISFIAMFFTNILMPFYLNNVKNISDAQVIGLIMMAFPLAMAIVAPISGWLSDKIGFVILNATGLSVVTLGFLLLSTINAGTPMWRIFINMGMFGFGMGLFQSPNNSSVMGAVPRQKAGIAGGINAAMRNVGMAIGIAVSVTIFTELRSGYLAGISHPTTTQMANAFSYSIDRVFLVGAAISFVGIFVSLVKGKYHKKPQAAPDRA